MGLLSLGEPLSWEETKKHAEHVRQHGIKQFLSIFKARRNRSDEFLKWGDEIEYIIVKFDDENKKVRVSLRAEELLKKLQADEDAGLETESLWRPEFGMYMVEGTPGLPYGIDRSPLEKYLMKLEEENGHVSSASRDQEIISNIEEVRKGGIGSIFAFLNGVEPNIRLRRELVESMLKPDEAILTISSFPRLGTPDFCWPQYYCHPDYGFAQSIFFPDEGKSLIWAKFWFNFASILNSNLPRSPALPYSSQQHQRKKRQECAD